MNANSHPDPSAAQARINGVELTAPGEIVDDEALCQRACCELLRQAAVRNGLLHEPEQLSCHGILSERASEAVDALLSQQVQPTEPTRAECLRHFAHQPTAFGPSQRVHLRHILFAVTPGADILRLRAHAERVLRDLASGGAASATDTQAFALAAQKWSNCPSGAHGGDLGWLTSAECAPEFARAVFDENLGPGVVPRLVHSRFGLHIVDLVEQDFPPPPSFEDVESSVRAQLRQRAWTTALRQYLQALMQDARLEGVDALGLTPANA